jgi:transcriptional regulator with XRE-family HTH domain
MPFSVRELGQLVKAHRERRKESQDDVAKAVRPETNRSVIAHLEQGIRVPQPEQLRGICEHLAIPELYWLEFAQPEYDRLAMFHEALGELIGRSVDQVHLDAAGRAVARDAILELFKADLTEDKARDWFNSLLVLFSVRPQTSREFFSEYLGPEAFKSPAAFMSAVRKYQKDAIRLFNSFSAAYELLNVPGAVAEAKRMLAVRDDASYRGRTHWQGVERIEDERLPDLGYIAAAKIREERAERAVLSAFLRELADGVRVGGKAAVDAVGEKKRRKMDSLLRKFNSGLQHGFLSPLFAPDADQLMREADTLAPKEEADLKRIEDTQRQGLRNLARYLSADHLDVYVATSMRVDADFVSVNDFVTKLFAHEEVRALRLRYFNPTQSWIEDRVAKGLVEALMLKRADITVYMAQKGDTFGKDSEASVALGQGKPVIVFVPKLLVPEAQVDSAELGGASREQLIAIAAREGVGDDQEVDDTVDHRAMLGRVLDIRLRRASGYALAAAVVGHWADFGLYEEASRIEREADRAAFRRWLDRCIKQKDLVEPPGEVHGDIVRMLVATAVRFEDRAALFRKQHPLALQVILSTGVLNGMIVVRSVESCANIMRALIKNDLDLDVTADEGNYLLVERTTKSTVRVISRHALIGSAFATFYAAAPVLGQRRGV